MTAARRRRKAGRPRKEGNRHPGGKLVQPPPHERADVLKAPVLAARCRDMGWPDTAENRKRADAQHMGTLHGRMWEAGALVEAQWRGLDDLLLARVRWLRSIGAPPETAQGASLGYLPDRVEAEPDHSPPLPEDPRERARRLANAWMAAEQAGRMASGIGFNAALGVIAGRPPRCPRDVEALRICADALAVHFGWAHKKAHDAP